jgi:hypothetical protein
MDIKKMQEYISNNGPSVSMKGEYKDCAVRAVAAAFDVSYDTAHIFAESNWKRKRRRGTNTRAIIKTMDEVSKGRLMFNKKAEPTPTINEYPTKRGVVKCKSKLSTFANKNNKGTYFVLVRAHATVVKDGIVLDNYSPGSTVKHAWKIKDIK